MKLKHWILVLMVFCAWTAGAQIRYRHINASHGLPTLAVNKIEQDNRGYIWFATNAGLCRFDGTTVLPFTSKDGCPENEILNVLKDKSGYIWLSSYTGDLLLMRNDSFFSAENMPRLKVNEKLKFAISFHNDHEGNVWLADDNLYKFTETSAEKITNQSRLKQVFFPKGLDYFLTFNAQTAFAVSYNDYSVDTLFKEMEITDAKNAECHLLDEKSLIISFRNHNTLGLYIFDLQSKTATKIKNRSTSRQRIYDTCIFEDGLFYVCTSNGVLRFRASLEGLKQPPIDTLLQQKSVCSVFRDREGILWFATVNDGAYYAIPDEFDSFASVEMEEGLYGIAAKDDKIIFGGNNEDYYWCQKKDFGKVKLTSSPQSPEANYSKSYRCALYDGNKYFWLAGDGVLSRINLETNKRESFEGFSATKSIAKRKNGNILLGIPGKLVELNPNHPDKPTVLLQKRTIAVAEDNEENIWSGHLDGLYTYFKNGKSKYWGEKHPGLSGRITDIAISDENVAWVGTQLSGIFIIKSDTIIQISAQDGLSSNIVKRVKLSGENTAFLTTNFGLTVIRIKSWKPFVMETQMLNSTNGLSSDDTWDVLVDSNFVYVTTSKGVERLDIESLQSSLPPKVFLSKCLINNKPIADLHLQELSHRQNNLLVTISAISYKSKGNLAYKYRLKGGLNEEWVTTSNPLLQFFELAPGDYQLQVMAQSSSGVWSSEAVELTFHINPPFWQKNWFRALVLMMLCGGIFLFFSQYKKNIDKQNNQKIQLNQQLYEMELNAIKAQMNPHFIFNCLNSIQIYIVKKDFVSSNHYLSSFAKLIRKSMELAKSDKISIAEELEFIDDYINLESMRFDKSFEYKKTIDPYINLNDYEIRTMMIQPLVENAINHALLPLKEKQGVLEVKIQKQARRIVISVVDNGIGIEESYRRKKNKSIRHDSNGIIILQNRIAVFNKVLEEAIDFEISKLKNENETGTIAIISIPLLKKTHDDKLTT